MLALALVKLLDGALVEVVVVVVRNHHHVNLRQFLEAEARRRVPRGTEKTQR